MDTANLHDSLYRSIQSSANQPSQFQPSSQGEPHLTSSSSSPVPLALPVHSDSTHRRPISSFSSDRNYSRIENRTNVVVVWKTPLPRLSICGRQQRHAPHAVIVPKYATKKHAADPISAQIFDPLAYYLSIRRMDMRIINSRLGDDMPPETT